MHFEDNSNEVVSEEENQPPSTSTDTSKFFRVVNLKFPLCPVFQPEPFQSAFAYRPETGDIILTSYPKCDTKVIEVILWKLMYPQSELPVLDNLTNRYLPCMEMVGLRQALSLKSSQRHHHHHQQHPHHLRPRLVKTHLPFHLMPFYTRAKYVYVVRNPWDASAAYHKFLKLVMEDSVDQSFDVFFHRFLAGEVPYGDFFEHVSMWQKYIEYENVLILSYDLIKTNPRGSLFVVAAFLGERHIDELVRPGVDEDLAGAILKLACPDEDIKRSRKRQTAAWASAIKTKCSEEQIKLLEQRIRQTFDRTGIEHLWTSLLKKER